ncbi:TIGR00730 family Rossman fold protein [Macrococcoides caseolyticum]|uniref:LOG family protein n=1 Tax=Macrococcoides caseolyticum TaxID=69966 RepID=UPI000C333584|nr:TIGR00730 family Rossman fold protein [Macrococcus caseolyticus]PKE06416.1 TIGR00730 family Rossman fold protein [Macrococcus caseolyticus]PKE23539.1 TIGR00730 family Rossman fold protein [Macrococcus caseolyticus]PKE52877.1 TIGR00730 family Rossman fold protein [Macrococcus caseolyticus]PKF37871.1 TIGR00730 family Rossman fold protein [Macrococcus caseolyticus]PKF44346.1 TIGR00730 family Rossman fold protein [Macrococcus caseolyticus]
MDKVCIFCGSNSGNNNLYQKAVLDLIEIIKKEKMEIIYGGGKVGLMGLVATEAIKSKVYITGIMPEFLIDREIAHNQIDKLIKVRDMSERINMMADLSNGFLILPGGFGTFEELFEVLSWSQMGLHEKPIGVLNINGFFNPIIDLINNTVNSGFAPEKNKELIIIDSSVENLLSKMKNFKHELPNKYMN